MLLKKLLLKLLLLTKLQWAQKALLQPKLLLPLKAQKLLPLLLKVQKLLQPKQPQKLTKLLLLLKKQRSKLFPAIAGLNFWEGAGESLAPFLLSKNAAKGRMVQLRPLLLAAMLALTACGSAPSADGLTPQEQEKLDAAAKRLDDQRAGLPDRSAPKDAPAAE